MDIKSNRHIDSSSFIDTFQNWVQKKEKVIDGNTQGGGNTVDMGVRKTKPATVHKTKKLRVLIKRLPRKMPITKAIEKPPIKKFLPPTRPIGQPVKYRWLEARQSMENPYAPKLQQQSIAKPATKTLLNLSAVEVKKERNIALKSSLLNKSTSKQINAPLGLNSSKGTDIMEQRFIRKAAPEKCYRNQMNTGVFIFESSTNKMEDDTPKVTKTLVNKTKSIVGQPKSVFKKIEAVPLKVGKIPNERLFNKTIPIAGQSKSVQTKFTCNDNISGIIDTQDFNINCFYCYEIFPIKNWKIFLHHIKCHQCSAEQTQKIANLLTSQSVAPPGLKIKGGFRDVKLGGLKRSIQSKINKQGPSSKRLRKNTKTVVSDLNEKVVEDLDYLGYDVSDMPSTKKAALNKKFIKPLPPNNDKDSDTNQNTPTSTKHFIKLVPPKNKKSDDTYTPSPAKRFVNLIDPKNAVNATEVIGTNATTAKNKKFTKLIEAPTKLFVKLIPPKEGNDKSVPSLRDLKNAGPSEVISTNTPPATNKFVKLNPPKEQGNDVINMMDTPVKTKKFVNLIPTRNSDREEKGSIISLKDLKNVTNINLSTNTTEPTKKIIKLIHAKDVKKEDNVNISGDLKKEINTSSSMNTPATTLKLVKLISPTGKMIGELPRNLPIVEIKNGKLSSVIVEKRRGDLTPTSVPINALSPTKKLNCYINSSYTFLDLGDKKKNIIKLPPNIKIVRKSDKDEASKESTATIIQGTEIIPVEEKPRVYAVKKLLKSNTSKEEDVDEVAFNSENKSGSMTLDITTQSTESSFKSKDLAELKSYGSVSEITISPRSLSPSAYWDSEEEKYDIDYDYKDSFTTSTRVCSDAEETEKLNINSVTTTSIPSTDPLKDHNVAEPLINATIEPVTPEAELSVSKQSSSSQEAPFPSRYLDSEDEMPSNDENEDELPSSTNGCGILFGLTNSDIVSEFLQKLEKYPDLYKFNPNSKTIVNCNDSIAKLLQHINETFNIDMTEFEIRLSIQRIKYWYCRTLQKLEHCKKTEPNKPFKHTFPQYFKIMERFLSYDVNYTKDLVLGRRFHSDQLQRYPTWMVCKPGAGPLTSNRYRNAEDDALSGILMDIKPEDLNLEFAEDEMLTDSEEERPPTSTITHMPPDPIICDICFVDFECRIDLRRHRIGHFPPNVPCLTCRRMHYTRLMAAKCSHVNTTANKKKPAPDKNTKYTCDKCGAYYKSVGTLNYHIKYKHFNKCYKCEICHFTCQTNYQLVQHRIKRHVVEFGTCEEILKRTRSRPVTKVPYTEEERKEFLWGREMRKYNKPGDIFFGCYKCKLVFNTRTEKMAHNRTLHPIKDTTVACLLCHHENALFANSASVRRHYGVVHKVPPNEIDDLVRRTKPLCNMLTADDIDRINSSENRSIMVAQVLSKNGSYSYEKSEYDGKKMIYRDDPYDDESNDGDLDQSTLYNEFEINLDYDENNELSGPEDHEEYDEDVDFDNLVDIQQFNENNGELFIVEENFGHDYLNIDMDQVTTGNGYGEQQIIQEEIVIEEDFYTVMEDCY